MNLSYISSITKDIDKLEIVNIDDAATEIAAFFLSRNILFFDNRTPIIKLQYYYSRISDDDAEALIVTLLDDKSRMAVSSSQIKEAVKRMRYAPQLQIDLSADFMAAQQYVNVLNGVYDIFTQKTEQVRNQYKFDYVLNFHYEAHCKLSYAPNFEKFVKTSIGMEQYSCLMRIIGYCLSSLTKGRKAFVFYGTGKTGKSTLLNIIESVVPDGLVSHEPFYTMSGERAKSHYLGKRLNISRETSAKINRNEESFKSLISNEFTTGSEKFEKSKDFIPTLSFLFAGNTDLQFSALDDEILDRLVYIMFTRKIKAEDIDLDLEEKLMEERNVIFSLALDSLKGLINDKYDFRMSDSAEAHIQHKRMMIHSAESFLDDKAEISKGSSVSSAALYGVYCEFCSRNGVKPIGRNKFYERVKNYDPLIEYGRVPDGCDTVNTVNGFKNLKLNWNPEAENNRKDKNIS